MPSIHQVQLSNTDEPVTPPQPEQRHVEPLPQRQPDSQDLILGKFKSYDELARAYKELESKLGQPKQQQEQQQSQAKPNALVQIESQSADTPKGEVTMEDFARYEEEYATEGKLSDKTYEELESRGIPRRVVDDYIAGQVARAEQA